MSKVKCFSGLSYTLALSNNARLIRRSAALLTHGFAKLTARLLKLSSNQHVGLITLHLKSASECRFWPYLHIFRQQISYVSFSWQRDEANMFSVFQTMALLRARHAENAELFQKVVHPIHHGFYFPVKMIWEMQLILFMIYPNHPYCSLRPSARWGGRPPHYLQWMASVWRCLTRLPKDKAGAQDALTWPQADSQIHQGFLQIWSFCETKNPKYSLSFIHSNAFQLVYDFVSSITYLNMLRKTPASVRPTRLHRSLGTHLKAKYISKLVHYDSNTKNLNTSAYSPQIHNLPSKTIYFIQVLSIFLLNFHVSIFSACRDFRSSPGSSPQPVRERRNGVLPALGVAPALCPWRAPLPALSQRRGRSPYGLG